MSDIHKHEKHQLHRRDFLRLIAAGSAGMAVTGVSGAGKTDFAIDDEKPATNIKEALAHSRNENSMPGKFPGRVVQVEDAGSTKDGIISREVAGEMLRKGMLALTGAKDISEAWRTFVKPTDRIGLKVNPVAGKDLSTSPEVTQAVIDQLLAAGIPQSNIMIWDRREFELSDAGFTKERFPGIVIKGTECKDAQDSFYDKNGKLYGEERIDKAWYYWADVEETYDAETLPYMINQGKHSYFSRIVTQELDKIINIPILKNAGNSVTLAMKNLAYGSISNTGRLHKKLWSETCAEVCAFPPLRDKVVLNICDGIKGCFNGGPGANPQYFHDFKTMLLATDPVALDRIGYEIILKKRKDEGIQKEETPRGREFMNMAQNLQLGVADIEKIDWKKI